MTEAEIDETLAASFPASDPPSWTLGIDRRKPTDTVETAPLAQPTSVPSTEGETQARAIPDESKEAEKQE